ncbi:MAG: ATP-binding cassette domain-containing protein [Chitinivibrionales bacterium]|nr:ATP-binding cassette domain-containing protein [Chitinivibrionales bacterium]
MDTNKAHIEDLSPELSAALTRLLGDSGPIVAAVSTDIAPDGSFAEGLLVATDTRLLSCSRTGDSLEVHSDIPLKQILSFERRDLRGVCRLEAHTRGSVRTVAYFTRSRQSGFAAAVEALSPLIAAPAPAPDDQPDNGQFEGRRRGGIGPFNAETRICDQCGHPIPRRIGFCPTCVDRRQLLLRLMTLAKPYALPMAGGLLLMLLITAVEMAQPLLTKVLVDRVIPNADLQLFAYIIAGIIGIHTFSSLFSGTRGYLMAWLGNRIVHDLRTDVYEHLQTLSIDFYDQHQTGWVMDRVSADTGNLQHFLAEGFQDFVRDIMTLLVILAIMFTMNWSLALITLIPAPFVFLMTGRFMRRVRRRFHAVWRRRAAMTSLLSSVIPGVRVVKAFDQERSEAERFTDRSRSFMDAGVQASRTFATFHPAIHFVTSLGFVMVWSYGGYGVITGRGVTLGTLIAFISYLWRFYGPLNSLSRFSQRVERATTSAQRVFDILDTEPTVIDPPDQRAMPPIEGHVAFKAVSFGYDPDEPVLQDVSFTTQPGEMIGLVGPSGAGKSTAINLLCRFYDVDQGTIEIDGHDIRQVSLSSLHRQIGVVLQEPYLFYGTIADNIAYGRAEASREQIMEAALAANAHEFIMRLPDGYDTLVGERGQRLSGGERQRISIARAILKNPRILILDEATSSVDTETEAAIQKAIERLVRGRTTFAIAHRFSTLRNADRLVVLDEGRVAEVGTHEELLAREDGLFRRLVDIQTETNRIVAVGG